MYWIKRIILSINPLINHYNLRRSPSVLPTCCWERVDWPWARRWCLRYASACSGGRSCSPLWCTSHRICKARACTCRHCLLCTSESSCTWLSDERTGMNLRGRRMEKICILRAITSDRQKKAPSFCQSTLSCLIISLIVVWRASWVRLTAVFVSLGFLAVMNTFA